MERTSPPHTQNRRIRSLASFYETRVRPFLRQALVRIAPGPTNASRFYIVAGLPRSGTSWLAKAISLAQDVSYYFEPDGMLGEDYRYKYIKAGQKDCRLKNHIDKAFGGHIVDEYVIAEQGFREIFNHYRSHSVLLKLVFLPLCLEWIARQIPNITVIQIVRHPVPQFLSWRTRDWDVGYNLQLLLDQTELMQGPLKAYAPIMKEAETYWQKVGAFWGAVAHMQLRAHRAGWFLMEHEWYCADATDRIGWLIGQLGLAWSPRIADFVSPERRILKGPGYGLRRDPKSEIHKWEGAVTDAELRTLQETLNYFDLPFYPNLDPEATWTRYRA